MRIVKSVYRNGTSLSRSSIHAGAYNIVGEGFDKDLFIDGSSHLQRTFCLFESRSLIVSR